MPRQRTEKTDDQIAAEKHRRADARRLKRAQETSEQRAERLARDRESRRTRRQQDTDQVRDARIVSDRDAKRAYRAAGDARSSCRTGNQGPPGTTETPGNRNSRRWRPKPRKQTERSDAALRKRSTTLEEHLDRGKTLLPTPDVAALAMDRGGF
ncbi:hypothetical protein HPB49_014009 [Dermacentor silvarum]|uniref:Uncharacterized protein n=1 Tax=Dermacentor silvarum TaxID=543639 RepID=A0ACB8DDE6_DERSI|nr:hypothetical protein HPB49_014009 [Dermacentor silvarum]